MPYIHSVSCPKCGHRADVCTSDEDGYGMGTLFEYRCPNASCGRRIGFAAAVVQIEDGPSPAATVVGQLIKKP